MPQHQRRYLASRAAHVNTSVRSSPFGSQEQSSELGAALGPWDLLDIPLVVLLDLHYLGNRLPWEECGLGRHRGESVGEHLLQVTRERDRNETEQQSGSVGGSALAKRSVEEDGGRALKVGTASYLPNVEPLFRRSEHSSARKRAADIAPKLESRRQSRCHVCWLR